MVTVAFTDSAGRPVAGAVVSIAWAPGEFPDIGMVTDERGEIDVTAAEAGTYEFVVFRAGTAYTVQTRITGPDERVTVVVD